MCFECLQVMSPSFPSSFPSSASASASADSSCSSSSRSSCSSSASSSLFPQSLLKSDQVITCFLRGAGMELVIDSRLFGLSGRGAARVEDARGTPTQSHTPPSILLYASFGLTGSSQFDMLGLRYDIVNFGEKKTPAYHAGVLE